MLEILSHDPEKATPVVFGTAYAQATTRVEARLRLAGASPGSDRLAGWMMVVTKFLWYQEPSSRSSEPEYPGLRARAVEARRRLLEEVPRSCEERVREDRSGPDLETLFTTVEVLEVCHRFLPQIAADPDELLKDRKRAFELILDLAEPIGREWWANPRNNQVQESVRRALREFRLERARDLSKSREEALERLLSASPSGG